MTDERILAPSPRLNLPFLVGATSATAFLSCVFLPWPLAAASTLLGLLMAAGADVDARTFILPDAVTYGAAVSGVIAAPVLDFIDPWESLGLALLRAAATALLLYLLRMAYARFRGVEGLGLGDVKLAAAVGAWIPVESIPICFGLAAAAGLVSVLIQGRKEPLGTLKLQFGAYLCPALWLVFFVTSLPG